MQRKNAENNSVQERKKADMNDFAPFQHKRTSKTPSSSPSSSVLQPAREVTPPTAAPAPTSGSSPDGQAAMAQAERFGHSISHLAIHPAEGRMGEEGKRQASAPTSLQTAPASGPLHLQQTRTASETDEQRQENRTGLPDSLKAGIERLSGSSLSDVRVHYNSSAPAEVDALAYTQGKEIHVGPGQEQHLAHEAWHVVQQKQGRVQPTIQMKGKIINDDQGLEREADVMGGRALEMQAHSSKSEGHASAFPHLALNAVEGPAPIQAMMKRPGSPTLPGSKPKEQRGEEEDKGAELSEEEDKKVEVSEEEKTEDFQYNGLGFNGIEPGATDGWEKQAHEDNCWAACTACLMNTSQEEILERFDMRNWSNQLATANQIEEMISILTDTKSQRLTWSSENLGKIFQSIGEKKPVMVTLAEKRHAVVAFAYGVDDNAPTPEKQLVFLIWDPNPSKAMRMRTFADLNADGANNVYMV